MIAMIFRTTKLQPNRRHVTAVVAETGLPSIGSEAWVGEGKEQASSRGEARNAGKDISRGSRRAKKG